MQPGEDPLQDHSSRDSFWIPDLSMTEDQFLHELYSRAREFGVLDPLFPGMVLYNVPGHLMRNLWPEKLEQWKKKPVLMGFAANESGWKGKLDALQSRLDPNSGHATLQKNFVMQGSQCIALSSVPTAEAQSSSNVALCWVPLQDKGLQLAERTDAESRFEFGGETFLHYRMSGEVTLANQDFRIVSSSVYRRFGPVFMLREVTGLGAIALGILEHHGISVPSEKYLSECAQNRSQGRPKKSDLIQAQEFIGRLCESVPQRHPLWDRMKASR